MWNYANWSNDSKLIVTENKKNPPPSSDRCKFPFVLIHNQVDYASSNYMIAHKQKKYIHPQNILLIQ